MTYNKDTLPLTDYHQYYRMKLLKGILPHLDKCLILNIIGIFSCKNEKNIEGIKINLLTIELDYHFLDYSLLRNSIAGVGGYTSFDLQWVTRGPDASWHPAVTVTQAVVV